jgi:GTP pyrophosphokinase
VGLILIAADRKGLLRDISSALADADGNVLGSDTQSDPASDVATCASPSRCRRRPTWTHHRPARQLPDVLSVERRALMPQARARHRIRRPCLRAA